MSLVEKALQEADELPHDEVAALVHSITGVNPAERYVQDDAAVLARLKKIAHYAEMDKMQFSAQGSNPCCRPPESWRLKAFETAAARARAAQAAYQSFKKYVEGSEALDSMSESLVAKALRETSSGEESEPSSETRHKWYLQLHQMAGTDPHDVPLDIILGALEDLHMSASIEADAAEEPDAPPDMRSKYARSMLRLRAGAIEQAVHYLSLYDEYERKLIDYEKRKSSHNVGHLDDKEQ